MNSVPTVLILVTVAVIISISSLTHRDPFSSLEKNSLGLNPSYDLPPRAMVQWTNESIKTPPTYQQIISSVSSSLQTIAPKTFLNSFSISASTPKEYKITTEDLDSYYASLLGVFQNHSFTEQEFVTLKKNAEGRFLMLEELAEQAAAGSGIISDLRDSFDAWEGIDTRVLTDLRTTIKAPASLTAFHASLIAWFSYHKDTAAAFRNHSMTSDEAATLLQLYSEKAKRDAPNFTELFSSRRSFSFIPVAHAQIGGPAGQAQGGLPKALFFFGGKVEGIEDVCISGILYSVGDPVGGKLFVYTPLFALNPYQYKLFTPGVWVLGKSLPGPGVCTKTGFDYTLVGQAQVLFWGSSKP